MNEAIIGPLEAAFVPKTQFHPQAVFSVRSIGMKHEVNQLFQPDSALMKSQGCF
jgi:hypothetical protein